MDKNYKELEQDKTVLENRLNTQNKEFLNLKNLVESTTNDNNALK